MAKVMDKKEILSLTRDFLEFFLEKKKFWVDYDDEADVLYLSFRKPQKANDSVMKEDIVYHYDNDNLVGVTVLNARKNVETSREN